MINRTINLSHRNKRDDSSRYNFTFLIVLVLLFLQTACSVPKNRCLKPFTGECQASTILWEQAIDTIVRKNYPSEVYKAVVWQDDFDNAWVLKGMEINITERFLHKLSPVQRIMVAAHELGHLKMNHYYSQIGITMVEMPPGLEGHEEEMIDLSISKNQELNSKGFSEELEKEADRMALLLLEQVGISPLAYINFLNQIRYEGEVVMTGRIAAIEKFIGNSR